MTQPQFSPIGEIADDAIAFQSLMEQATLEPRSLHPTARRNRGSSSPIGDSQALPDFEVTQFELRDIPPLQIGEIGSNLPPLAAPSIDNATDSNSATGSNRDPLTGSAPNAPLVLADSQDDASFDNDPLNPNDGEEDITPADQSAPALTVALAEDTGLSGSDAITANPAVRGTLTDTVGPITTFEARINGSSDFMDVLETLNSDGTFQWSRQQLEQLYGSVLSDGEYIIELQARDRAGNVGSATLAFLLDTTIESPRISLEPSTDSGEVGDLETDVERVTLEVEVEAGSRVRLEETGQEATADELGVARLENVVLQEGANRVAVRATDVAGNESRSEVDIQRIINQAPTEVVLSNQSIAENSVVGTVVGSLNTIDVDGDSFRYELVEQSEEVFELIGDRLVLAAGATLDREQVSSYDVTILSTDDGDPPASIQRTFTIEVLDVNETPSFTSYPNTTTLEAGERFDYDITTTDPEGDPLTITSTELPDWLTLSDNGDGTAQLFGTPDFADAGLLPVELTVTDSDGNQATQLLVMGVDFVLREGESFTRQETVALTVPERPSLLTFTLDAVEFDITDPDAINDAVEIALVDAQGNPLSHGFEVGRDAFLNWTEGETRELAPGVTFDADSGEVTVNLVGVEPGTVAHLVFRLVNNDSDTETAIRVSDIQLVDAPLGTVAPSRSGELTAGGDSAEAPNFSQLDDVSGSLVADYGQTSFDERTGVLSAEVTLRNVGTYGVDGPIYVVVTNLSNPSVLPRGAAGLTPEGQPYFRFDALTDGQVNPGDSTGVGTIEFFNSGRSQFTYDLVVLADLNDSPTITSDPLVPGRDVAEAVAGIPFEYQVTAIDPNDDTLTYELIIGPEGLTLDAETGLVTWLPSDLPADAEGTDVGNHSVVVQVSDGRGGVDLQSFTLATIELPPNRPPIFTNDPEVDAYINQLYRHDADAIDPDGDPISFRVVQGPEGLTIDRETGEIEFTPPPVLVLGDTVLATTRVAGERDTYRFSGSVGQLIYLDTLVPNNREFEVRVIGPNGRDILAAARRGSNAQGLSGSAFLLLPETGNYELVVDPRDFNRGFYGFSLIDAAAVPSIELDQPVSGSIAPGVEDDIYRFSANGGQKLFIDLLQRTARSLNQPWKLYNARGETIGSFSDVADRELYLPEDGDYFLVIEGKESFARTDHYTFELITPDEITRPMTLGTNDEPNSVSGSIDEKGEEDIYTFEGRAGQRILFDHLFSELVNGGSNHVEIFDPNGQRIFEQRFFTTNSHNNPRNNFAPITLARDGIYSVRIDGSGEERGSYRFSVLDLERATPIALDTEYTGTLPSGQENHAFSFTAEAGQRLFLDARTSSGSGSWVVYDAANVEVVRNTSIRGDMEHVFERGGEYTLVLRGDNAGTPLEYGFELITPDTVTTPLTVNTPVISSLSEKGERDVYRFSGRTGQILFLDALSQPANIRVTLRNPLGTVLSGWNAIELRSDQTREPFVLTGDGSYQLEIDGTGAHTGEYRFQVLDIAAAATVLPESMVNGGTLAANELQVYAIEARAGERLYFDRQVGGAARWQLYGPSLVEMMDTGLERDFETVIQESGTYYLLLHNQTDTENDFSVQWESSLADPTAIELLPNTTAQQQSHSLRRATGLYIIWNGWTAIILRRQDRYRPVHPHGSWRGWCRLQRYSQSRWRDRAVNAAA